MTLTPDGGLTLAVARSCAVAGLLSAFGSLAFAAVVLAKVLPRNPDASGCEAAIRVLARWSLAVAMAGLLAWGVLQTADFAHSGADPAALARAWPVVLLHTAFGHVWLAQVAAVLAAGLALPRSPRLALAFSAAAVLLQGGHSHAAAMDDEPSLLLASDLVHLAAAGAWLGGLAPLALVVRGASPRAGASAARWFSPLGKWCVTAMVATAGFQFWALVGGLPGLVGTAYGWVALAKFALLGVLFGFALWNRYDLAPALLGADPEAARRRLVRSVLVQTGFGVATVLAAGVLSSLPPALHEQPVWPFSQRPSLAAMTEPELAAEIGQGTALAAGSAILLASLAWFRLRPSCWARERSPGRHGRTSRCCWSTPFRPAITPLRPRSRPPPSWTAPPCTRRTARAATALPAAATARRPRACPSRPPTSPPAISGLTATASCSGGWPTASRRRTAPRRCRASAPPSPRTSAGR